jgi:hypothetical protein
MALYSTSNSNLNFTLGETAFQANTDFTGVVKEWNPTTQMLEVYAAVGVLANNSVITGNSSTALYTIKSFDYKDFSGVTETIADNKQIKTEADLVLDLTTGNPFGLPD